MKQNLDLRVRQLKYFTKKDEKTWYVQSIKERNLESFYHFVARRPPNSLSG